MSSFSASTEQRGVGYAMIKCLQTLKGGDSAKVATAVSAISDLFGVSAESADDFKSLDLYPATLDTIFKAGVEKLEALPYEQSVAAVQGDQFNAFVESVKKKGIYKDKVEGTLDYMVVHSKVIAKFNQKKASTGAGAAVAAGAKSGAAPAAASVVANVVEVVPVSAELAAQAEDKKNAGNAAIQKQNYNAAIRHYSDAIDLVPQGETSYVYYSNRAAAHCYLNNYTSAVEDCQSSLALNSTYTKAYSRMGLAYYHLENYEKSVEAYAKCVELEPKVKSHKDGLMSAKAKLTDAKAVSSSAGAGAGGGGGGLDAILKNPDMMKQAEAMMGGMGGGAGGPGGGGLADLLKNPQMMKMAEDMAKNPAMLQQAMSMLGGGGGGAGGGMPDMGALSAMMGGMGGMGGGPSSSSSSSGKK